MYKVIYPFKDLQDKTEHRYIKDDNFPFDNREISFERLEELLTNNNAIGKPLIEVEETVIDETILTNEQDEEFETTTDTEESDTAEETVEQTDDETVVEETKTKKSTKK